MFRVSLNHSRSFKVIENGTMWKLGYGFLFALHSNIRHRVRGASEYCHNVWYGKTSVAIRWWKKFEDMFSRFERIPACDGQTNRQTDGQTNKHFRQHRPRYAEHRVLKKIHDFRRISRFISEIRKIGPKLLRNANRHHSYAIYRIVTLPITVSDLKVAAGTRDVFGVNISNSVQLGHCTFWISR